MMNHHQMTVGLISIWTSYICLLVGLVIGFNAFFFTNIAIPQLIQQYLHQMYYYVFFLTISIPPIIVIRVLVVM